MSANRFTSLFAGRRQEAFTFAFCVLLAAIIWTVNALNKTYTVQLNVPVDYSLPQHAVSGLSEKQSVTIELQGKGFQLLGVQSMFSREVIRPGSLPHRTTDSTVHVREHIVSLLQKDHPDVKLIALQPELLPLVSRGLYQSRIPVKTGWNPKPAPRFLPISPAVVVPDSITIYSFNTTKEKGATITPVDSNLIDGNHTGFYRMLVQMNDPEQTFTANQSVWLYQPTEPSTEVVLKVPVQCRRHEAVLPSTIELKCRVPISRVAATRPEQFLLITHPEKTVDGYSLVSILHQPFWCQETRLYPESVLVIGKH
ncbi:MAG: hypothetical protein ACKOQY_10980 [Bacteroidota bacterium]